VYSLSSPLYTGHRCQKPGCAKALVVDGNMKNHRDVCSATNAGYVEYKGLPGRVRTGCPNTPSFKSSYCNEHKPTMAACSDNTKEEPVGLILGKRITRSTTLYQVRVVNCDD